MVHHNNMITYSTYICNLLECNETANSQQTHQCCQKPHFTKCWQNAQLGSIANFTDSKHHNRLDIKRAEPAANQWLMCCQSQRDENQTKITLNTPNSNQFLGQAKLNRTVRPYKPKWTEPKLSIISFKTGCEYHRRGQRVHIHPQGKNWKLFGA